MVRRFLFLTILLSLAVAVSAEVKLPSVLGNDMVLQRNSEVNLWGSATPDRTVTVRTSWNGKKYKTKSDSDGKWALKVATGEAGGPYEIEFSDGDKLKLSGILLGEVWVCGGQSNMEMPIKGFVAQPVQGAADAIRDSYAHPDIRIFNVGRNRTETPQDDCKGEWKKPTPQNVAECSATAYFFGRMLTDILGVPVGLVTSYWGGTKAEVWMTRDAIKATEGIDHAFALKPDGNGFAPQTMYNGMIAPIAKFTAKGFIWYQGCSNTKRYEQYKRLQPSFVRMLRDAWNNADMPFYFTQIAPHMYKNPNDREAGFFMWAQAQTLSEIPHSGMAATHDIGDEVCIHPAKKKPVGDRLAYLALTKNYGFDFISFDTPLPVSFEFKDGKAYVTFQADRFGISPILKDIEGLELAGEDQVFYPAVGRVYHSDYKVVEVSSPQVSAPVAVRYGMRNWSVATMFNNYGIPVSPFRSDDWKE